MRKLVFMLRVNPNPNSVTPKNLEISTHYGARLTIKGNQATVLDVTNDEMTDSELQTWYRSRYSGLGMGITLMNDDTVKVSNTEKEPEKVQVPKKTRKQSKKSVETKQETAAPKETVSIEISENQQVSKVEPKSTEIMPEPVQSDDVGEVADLQSFLWG